MDTLPPWIKPSELAGLSPETIQQLIDLSKQRSTSLTVAVYPITAVVYMAILWICAKVTEFLFRRYSRVYRKMTFANQRTSSSYVLSIVFTTVALILQLVASPALAQEYTVKGMDCIKLGGLTISLLYLFEMAYRESLRLQMLIHHLATVFAISFVAGSLAAAQHPSMIATALVWLFQATTEQATFVGLLMYRLQYRPKTVSRVLKFAAIQTLIPKFGFAIYLLVWWGQHQMRNNSTGLDIAFSVVFFICLFILIPTQVYGSWIIWRIANRIQRDGRSVSEAENIDGEGDAASPGEKVAVLSSPIAVTPEEDEEIGFEETLHTLQRGNAPTAPYNSSFVTQKTA